MKFISLLFIYISIALHLMAQKMYEPGLIDVEPEGIVNVITDIALSPDNKTLCLAGYYNRAYLFNVSQKGTAKFIWKNTNIKGMTSGSFVSFSKDGKYIMLKGYKTSIAKIKPVIFSSYAKAWQNDDDVCVLDAATGNVVLTADNAFAISIAGDVAFVSDKSGFKWFNLPSGSLIKQKDVEDNENAVISPSGKWIVECWDADKKEMKKIESVERRRTELKNAYRAKKMLLIYNTNDLEKPTAVSNDEIDVVTNIQFDKDEKFVYLQMQLAGEERSSDLTAYAFQRINLLTGEIDKSFGIKGNYCKLYNNNKVSSLFSTGTYGNLRQLRIQDIDNSEDFSMFQNRFKMFKPSTMLSPASLSSEGTTAYLYYEKHLFEWDYKMVKNYFKKSEGNSEEQMAVYADSIMDNYLKEDTKFYKEIRKNGITGDYIMDITLLGPDGMVQTVFCDSDEKTNILMQNKLKDMIRKLEFNVGLPKSRRLKFRYTFQL